MEEKPLSLIEQWCEDEGYKLAARIDKGVSVVLKPKPRWLPNWLYRKIAKEIVTVVDIRP